MHAHVHAQRFVIEPFDHARQRSVARRASEGPRLLATNIVPEQLFDLSADPSESNHFLLGPLNPEQQAAFERSTAQAAAILAPA